MYFKPVYIIIIGITITVDYIAGLFIERNSNRVTKKLWLATSLACNLGILALFKYYNFFDISISRLLHCQQPISPLLQLALPVGLSFHTFQAMSYTIEIYNGRQRAERHFGIFALYILFYPQLVAGPIERPQHLLGQFREEHRFNYNNAVSGLRLMMWGLFKKVVIADRLALVTDRVYWQPEQYSPVTVAVAVLFFSIQIYCDFSGYSDIAVGSARVMGFRLIKNFEQPYAAIGIADFWRRWHISLSNWFRDYVYIPLGGSRKGELRQVVNILIVFIVSGLWHGASITFIVWGAIHGIIYVAEWSAIGIGLLKRNAVGAAAFARRVATFMVITVTWVFFRAATLHKANVILGKLAGLPGQLTDLHGLMTDHPVTRWQLAICGGCIAALFGVQQLQRGHVLTGWLNKQPRSTRWMLYYFVLFVILIMGVYDNREFIYFQF